MSVEVNVPSTQLRRGSTSHDPTLSPPTMPAATSDLPSSRPLSEISDNSIVQRPSPRESPRLGKNGKISRPNSEVREGENKRLSGLQTITVNLVDYAASVSVGPKTPTTAVSTGSTAPSVPSPTTKPGPLKIRPVSTGSIRLEKGVDGELTKLEPPVEEESSKDGVSSLFMAKRLSLRPSPLGATYADVTKPMPSPPLSIASHSSYESARSGSSDFSSTKQTAKPATKTKPSWLRRASGTAALRSLSKSPVPKEEPSLPSSTSLPPALPARKNSGSPFGGSIAEHASDSPGMAPPEVPRRTSYAAVTATAGPSRSRLGEGQGRPAFSPTISGAPPLPPRDNIGNIRGRLAAWTSAAQSTSSFSRSESSASLASTSSPSLIHQRVPSSAQRVLGTAGTALGTAGTAVQKGWAGFRARGVTGSISSMSGLAQATRRGSMEPSGSWNTGLGRRGSWDRTQSDNHDARSSDGPIFVEGVVKRAGSVRSGKVFGRDLVECGRAWGVVNAVAELEGESEWDRRRKQCLPAVVIRAVDYLEVWGPKEEGIFRISGRSSHITRLRKEFDSGADLDLKQCHPGDLDPHAVAGIFKTYLRELQHPLLTYALAPKFDAYTRTRRKDSPIRSGSPAEGDDDIAMLLLQLPSAHWFLLADIVRLLHLIPQYTAVNRMTLNAVMLSLGPSLNISGGVLTELLERREELFSKPPPEATSDFIKFDDHVITPPAVPEKTISPIPTSETPASDASDGLIGLGLGKRLTPPKKSPRLPSKPSITRLFSGAGSVSKRSSVETMKSVVDNEPPRLETPITNTTPLPSFETDPVQPVVPPAERTENLVETAIDTPGNPPPAGIKRSPTPIADRFAGTGQPLPPLRNKKSSITSTSTSTSAANATSESSFLTATASEPPSTPSTPNPASVIRRGQPVFFQSAGHSPPRSTAAGGVKRKDDAVSDPNVDQTDRESMEAGRVKRLSAGPGSMSVREVVRGMEMTA